MMTMDAETMLTEPLQSLVDARLDTIDRMLIGRVNRHDRLAIVRDVESQIFEQLRGRDAGTLDRDDVLAVLARLDPPEAYLPDEDSPVQGRPARISPVPRGMTPSRDARSGRIDLASGILGIVSMPILMLGCWIGIALQSIPVYFGTIGLVFITGLLAIIFAARARLRSAWAVVGLVIGIFAMLAAIAGGLLA